MNDAGARLVNRICLSCAESFVLEVVPESWLKLDQDETPEYKGTPYIDATVTAVMKVWLVVPWGVAFAYASGGKQEVYDCFHPDVLWGHLPCGFLFSLGDVSEILAQGDIDPTTYIVRIDFRCRSTSKMS